MRAAIIPVKELSQAKARLSPLLDDAAREELVLAMLADVIAAARACDALDFVTVVGRDSRLFWQTRELGAQPLAEPATTEGLNDALNPRLGQR